MPTWSDVLAVPGFSSASVRSVLNLAVAAVPRARILEVGSYMGSTAVAMCFGNDVECIHMVDNHSEFGRTDAALAGTVSHFGLPAVLHDFNWLAPHEGEPFSGTTFNVYLYDGSHEERDHAAELAVAWPYLADSFLYIVDDYSWEKVRRGCDAGLAALDDRLTVVSYSMYDSRTLNDIHGYWNGLLVARCVKK